MHKKIIFYAFFLVTFFFFSSVCAQPSASDEKPADSVITGRVAIEQHGNDVWLMLHAKDAQTFRLRGTLEKELVAVIDTFGAKNMVTVTGRLENGDNIFCTRGQIAGPTGEPKLDVKCITYYNLEVTQLNKAGESAEEIPPPARNAAAEAAARSDAHASSMGSAFSQNNVIIQAEGTITAVNFRSPIKSVELSYLDKDGNMIKKSLLLNNATRIVKNQQQKNKELYLPMDALAVGQKVGVTYSINPLIGRADALFITIIQE